MTTCRGENSGGNSTTWRESLSTTSDNASGPHVRTESGGCDSYDHLASLSPNFGNASMFSSVVVLGTFFLFHFLFDAFLPVLLLELFFKRGIRLELL